MEIFYHGSSVLFDEDGTKRIADNTLVALTLMIAESRTEEKDTIVKVIVNLINNKKLEFGLNVNSNKSAHMIEDALRR